MAEINLNFPLAGEMQSWLKYPHGRRIVLGQNGNLSPKKDGKECTEPRAHGRGAVDVRTPPKQKKSAFRAWGRIKPLSPENHERRVRGIDIHVEGSHVVWCVLGQSLWFGSGVHCTVGVEKSDLLTNEKTCVPIRRG